MITGALSPNMMGSDAAATGKAAPAAPTPPAADEQRIPAKTVRPETG